jgi:hypothetical protein
MNPRKKFEMSLTLEDAALMRIADEQIDWIAEKLDNSREAGRLALLSILMELRYQLQSEFDAAPQ